jgi:hypothetical protein
MLYLAASFAGTAGFRLCPCFGAAPFARMAGFQVGDSDFFIDSSRSFF